MIITGHPCSPTSSIATTLQSKVFIQGLLAAVTGSVIAPHTILVGKFCVPHAAVTNTGSSKVFFGGIPANRIGDSADFGCIIQGASKVLIGG
jgi:uncharacterized Zn-binding protein involved in type VI secretion